MPKKYPTEIQPEEILLDKKAAAKLEIPVKKNGFFFTFSIAILILAAILLRTFWLQILRGDYYSERSSKNTIRLYQNRPIRGIVYDRNNKAFTENIPDFNLLIIPADLPKNSSELQKWIKNFSEFLKKDETEISDFVKKLNKSSTEPVSFDVDLNHDALILLETQLPNLPAVFISKETKRTYTDGDYFAHLVGYLGKVSSEDLKTNPSFSLRDFIGKDGLEAQYEEDLRGIPGQIAVFVNSDNTVLNTLIAKEPLAGNNLILSVDGNLQKLLTDALHEKMAQTNSSGSAAVVLDVKSGEILALVSLPSFDNNLFSKSLSSKIYQQFVNDKTRPFFNRAIAGAYPSGSTIKPFVASAALAENIISPDYKVDDTLGYITVPNQYNPDIIYTYHDWKAHGFVNMRQALAVSANVYFYTIGGGYKNIMGLGINRIEKYLKLFGFGSDLGIDLPGESSGLVPNPAWKKAVKKEDWFTGDTYNVSIGQGDILVTPLQMASGIAAIGNGGTLWRPKIVSKITDLDGKIVKEFKPETIRSLIINDEKLKIVREGMRGAVTNGSAWLLNDLPIKVAGKTGTAQVTNTFRKTNAWFTGFAPYDNPEIALAIIIEGAGEGSTAAVPIAKQIFEWYYNQNYDKLK